MTDTAITRVNGGHLQNRLAVWVDPDLCVGDAGCANAVPEIFEMRDGVAYVVGDEEKTGGPDHTRLVDERLEEDVVTEAELCPGECIFIDFIGETVEVEQVRYL